MRELPSGTVTMLFSDIEGSTALLYGLGDRYPETLSAQRDLLRDAIGTCHGHELGTEGDSFFAVFGSAADAVRCCLAAQRALAGHDWPGGLAVRVRMGLHSGEPARHDDGYVGLDVHLAARIAAAAHGGQVVLSDTTRGLAEPRLPPGVSVDDLGWHRLKDIQVPHHLYQLVAPGLDREFPSLRSLGARTSLPQPMTPLVGRQEEAGWIATRITRPGVRLVTLTGTGGVGKTRLALAVASSLATAFPDGVFFVPLAAVRDAGVMWKTLAEQLDARGPRPAHETVTEHLSDRHVLLVLDNLEQLPDAGGVVASLLSAAPGLVVLATSRRPLHLGGEHEQPVQPLEVPQETAFEQVRACASARLFAQQAAMIKPGFALTPGNAADVAAICRRLDGLPLAIELAASRVKLLSPGALLARLGRSLGLAAAGSGRPSRQQALRSTIAWSYDLLTSDLQDAFRRAGVFAGGCDLSGFAAVALAGHGADCEPEPLEHVAELLDVSLITVTEDSRGEPRVGMLETIREYALERLEGSGDLDVTWRRHAEYYAAVAERAAAQLRGPERLASLHRLEAEHDNLRAALSWALDAPARTRADGERTMTGLRLVLALAPYWYEHGQAAEGRRWLHRAYGLASGASGAVMGDMSHWLGVLTQQQSQNDLAVSFFQRSLAIWRELGEPGRMARELNSLGITHSHLGDLDTARAFLQESIAIARQAGNEAQLAATLTSLGHTESLAGNLELAAEAVREALALDTARDDMLGIAIDKQALAVLSLRKGDAEEARSLLSATIGYVVSSGDTEFLANTLEWSAAVTACQADHLRAARLTGAAEGIRQAVGMPLPAPYAAMLAPFLAPARAAIGTAAWEAELRAGRSLTEQQAAVLLRQQEAAPGPPS